MTDALTQLLELIEAHHGITDKRLVAKIAAETLNLVKDRSVYYCNDYAVRFSSSANRYFGNTVLSLSHLQKYDDRPFIVCVVTPTLNHCLIANTTFLKKISHSSQELHVNNIRGSFNGSDIVRSFEGIENTSTNIARLYAIHASIGFDGNLERLVEATNQISPSGAKFEVPNHALSNILASPVRAIQFSSSSDFVTLKDELDEKVARYRNEIMLAALIENANVRGRVIEYLIAGEDDKLRIHLVQALKEKTKWLPPFKTDNALGDYQRRFDLFDTETDVKTKILVLNSNPKAYNLDKMLEFLAREKSVFMFYFVGVDPGRIIKTVLLSMFQENLINGTILLRHWAGRNSRGVTQFEGKVINDLIAHPRRQIDEAQAISFLNRILAL